MAPRPVGWRTTDADEIALRRERAAVEPMRVENLSPAEPVFSTFLVRSESGSRYRVEIRSLTELENSCSCPDFRSNGLALCKHVEAVLGKVRKRPEARGKRRSPRAEVFLRRAGETEVTLSLPDSVPLSPGTREILGRYFDANGRLQGDPAEAVPSLVRDLPQDTTEIRVSDEVVAWATDRARRVARGVARQAFFDDLQAGRRSLNVTKLPLYPYQVDGMLHLAFGERALLGDEMGLGKTVQAVAACALLRELHGVERVLVVCPVSLKAEWEEQILKFTDLPFRLLQGTKPGRLAAYADPPFFTIANYEQAIRDVADINTRLRPDVVILDEAQRIKNWNTKTARSLKRLDSRFAFLLTGTPIENRIDEIYSIVDFLDPQVFGPLFRFNREFYELDDRGRPAGYRNLDELQRRIRPLLLRRRKDQIETQLPERVDNNYFVAMSPAQTEPYAEYRERVARLLAILKRRPLTREEQEKLQRWLACMRMLCDTPYILSPENRVCPKLGELEAVLEDLDVRRGRKAIVFSEWERMLELVRDLVREMGIDFAWHTGSVPQPKRREEIRRFKTDPGCRLFLSTDSGGLGLNLQTASVVVNLDLPWNPARLGQRIARAWRKHQTSSVHVVNLISEGTIEHGMLGTLAAKQQLADTILDGRGETSDLRMTSSREGFLDRLRLIMATDVSPAAKPPAPVPATPLERLRKLLGEERGALLTDLCLLSTDSCATAMAVVDGPTSDVAPHLSAEWAKIAPELGLPAELEVVDRATWEALQRLARRGLVPALAPVSVSATDDATEARRRERARQLLEEARRKAKMAELLSGGGFPVEAFAPARDTVETALRATAVRHGLAAEEDSGAIPESLLRGDFVARGFLKEGDADFVARIRATAAEALDTEAAERMSRASGELVQRLVPQIEG